MSSFEAYARALEVLEAWQARRQRGVGESPDALLAAHPALAEILEPMLAASEPQPGETRGAAPATPAWRGLPGEGDVFGGYRIERVLGQGGMGLVFLAEDVRLARKVALKVVRPERLGSTSALERFAREAKLAARLEHPNICPVYEVGEVDGTPFMAMRYLAGETLATRIAREGAPSATRAESARSRIDALLASIETVARALQFAHERGVVHRDVKPANILIEPDGTPIVLDFGMARSADDELGLTMTGELAGTPLYMAPEQVVPSGRTVDHRADVYSLGATLYEALTGQRPFGGQSMRELLDAIVKDSAPPPSHHQPSLPRDLDVVLDKAMEKDLARRYRTAAELADDLARVRAREPVLARRPSAWLRARRFVQRHPVAVGFFTLTATALAVISLFFVRLRGAQRDFELVAFVPRLDELLAEEEALHVRWPHEPTELQAWLTRAHALVKEVDVVRTTLARDGDADVDGARQFLRDTLRNVVARTDALLTQDGAIGRQQRNLDWVPRERSQLTTDAELWRKVAGDVASDPRFAGLVIHPQLGLTPLEPDPTTRLWEFLHTRSGQPPRGRNTRGQWRVDDDTGIVLVLLPGGTFTMGAQRQDPDQPNYDPIARFEETPPHAVTLSPFLLGKHEVTQGQWRRLTGGRNPADARPGSNFNLPLTLAHPVESLPWSRAVVVLGSAGLGLPSEAQWEYACRGNTTTPLWTGTEMTTLSRRENVADRSAGEAGAYEAGGAWELMIDDRVVDGFLWHAPADALEPNGFGLFHMAGNVQEWCRDRQLKYAANPAREGDGLRGAEGGEGLRVVRGGSFDSTPRRARSSQRFHADPATGSGNLGVRAARRLH